MDYKIFLRPPYHLLKYIWEQYVKYITNIQLILGLKPMCPPRCKVQKANKIKKILLAMMKYDYGFKDRGLSLEYYNIYLTLKNMGYEVEMFDFMSVLQEKGRSEMNKLLFTKVLEFDPDLVFFALFQEQFDKTLITRISKETRSITLNWFADDDWRFYLFSKFWAPCFNFSTTTYKNEYSLYKRLGYTNIILTQWAANDTIYKKLNISKTIDVSFVGTSYGNRTHIVHSLENSGIQVQCSGTGWKMGRVNQEEMIRIFNRSKISLNFGASLTLTTNQIKARTFEIPACGTFMLTSVSPNLEKCFVIGKEIEVFYNTEDLIKKIKYFLVHNKEREQIAMAGYNRVHLEHTYTKRLAKIFSEIENSIPRPTRLTN